MKDQLIAAGLALAGGALIAVLTWWLTEWSRDRADAAKDRAVAEAVLAQQSDALLLAVAGLHTAAETNRILWDGWKEHVRTILLASLAAGGGYARHDPKAPEWRRLFSAFGAASQLIERDRIAVKTAKAGLTADLSRLAVAAVPLLRHPISGIRQATDQVLQAAIDGGGRRTAQVDRAMAHFGEEVRAVLPTWSAAQ